MSKENKPMTAEQIYKLNKTKSKVFKMLGPITFWICIVLTIIFFALAIENSIGNVTEIIDLLDTDNYTGLEIEENYRYLVEKWGEWTIMGGPTSTVTIRYIDIREALFSGLMVTYTVLTVVFLVLGITFGKVVFPQLSKMYTNNNDEMVDLATLKSATQIDEMANKKKDKKEWF